MRKVELQDIAEIVAGQSPKSEYYNEDGEGVPFFQGKADFGKDYPTVTTWCTKPKKMAKEGDILFSVRAPVGPTNIADLDCCIGRGLSAIRPGDDIDRSFLRYYFKKVEKKISDRGRGSTFNSITQKDLKALNIPLPSLSEQKAIVAKLDRAQRLIDVDKEMLAKYDELIQSVFLEMFGDPVTNPKGLPQKNIKEIGEVITGNTPPKKNPENYGSEIEWVKTTNIIDEQLYPTTAEEYLSKQGKELGRIIPKNSLIVCCIAGSLSSIGKCSIVDRKIAINQQINAIVPNSEIIDTTFLYAQLLTGKKLIQDASTKSMKGMVSKSKFQKIELLLPDINAQQKFSTFFNKVGKEKLKLRGALKKSEELFSSLVQGAFG